MGSSSPNFRADHFSNDLKSPPSEVLIEVEKKEKPQDTCLIETWGSLPVSAGPYFHPFYPVLS